MLCWGPSEPLQGHLTAFLHGQRGLPSPPGSGQGRGWQGDGQPRLSLPAGSLHTLPRLWREAGTQSYFYL